MANQDNIEKGQRLARTLFFKYYPKGYLPVAVNAETYAAYVREYERLEQESKSAAGLDFLTRTENR